MKKNVIPMVLVAILLLVSANSNAQSLKDLLNSAEKVVNDVTGSKTADLKGNWSYTGSAVEFETENLLKKAGGSVASEVAEAKVNTQLKKIGIQPGQMTFIFNADSTFNAKVGAKNYNGTYSYNKSKKKVTLTFLKLLQVGAKINLSSNNMDMLFESDKLLKILAFLGSKSSDFTIRTASSLANGYDGMMLGFAFKKK